ncbi:carboxylesterase family protein [Nonomuraea sp. 3-1Str]|uniref:carboxylesterase/lipase family protein n=1 Tax=Nonomuraea sp. 3-1Str TaxID=2929801 RepID=UPI0028566C45|nr:carboxylesterase family protein [Nonomuraea sp. 3-1Str]MDR8409853.1 carboxylesterase family protein [Nonomuraea sp. 3-1Str]
MRKQMIVMFGLVGGLVTAAPAIAAPVQGAAPVVKTADGLVRGVAGARVRSFQGIPYAAPPVGERRWTSPAPVTPWSGVRDATSPGGACAQPAGYPIGVPSDNEDCLYLNVTAPTRATGRLPVIVWIHGGSLMYGTGDMYGPQRLAAGGAVVVSMNYRLGVMGFLANDAVGGEGSFGLQDQQAALRWVRKNVAAFGGDPGNVTIAGQSGGGYAVCDHLASPRSAGLFDRAIVQSSPCATDGSRTMAEAKADSDRVVEAVGCDGKEDVAGCLRRVPAATLLKAYGAFNEPRPVSGTAVLPLTPAEALRTGRFNRVPVLVGVNHDEENGMVLGLELAPGGAPMKDEEYAPAVRKRFGERADEVLRRYPLSRYDSAGQALAALGTDSAWSVPSLDTARLLARWTPTRMYEFAERDTPWFAGYPAPSFPARAQHMAELPYLFDMKLFGELTPAQARLGDRLIGVWTGFAAGGRTGWPSFRDGQYVQSLTSGAWRRTAFAEDHDYRFWKSLPAA